MTDTLLSGIAFLFDALSMLYMYVLITRLLLVLNRANYFDQFTQFIIQLTDFIVKPLRRVIPNIKQLETATLLLIIVLEVCRIVISTAVGSGIPSVDIIVVLVIGQLLQIIIQLFTYLIIFQAILSLLQPYSSINNTLNLLTAPIMRPLRRIIPTIAGIDITPIPALLLLQLVNIVLVMPLMSYALTNQLGM